MEDTLSETHATEILIDVGGSPFSNSRWSDDLETYHRAWARSAIGLSLLVLSAEGDGEDMVGLGMYWRPALLPSVGRLELEIYADVHGWIGGGDGFRAAGAAGLGAKLVYLF